jgi:uncharacterized SAM-binding protein YcdF (DUF218 family)
MIGWVDQHIRIGGAANQRFLFKQIFSRLLFPVPFCLEVLSIGLLLLWFTRKQKAGKALVAFAGALLFLFSSPFVSSLLITPLERRYPPLLTTPGAPIAVGLSDVKFIVVLGSGFVPDASRPVELQLDDGSIARLVEGVRVSKLLSRRKLIVSGGPEPDGAPLMAQAMAQLAQELGVHREEIILDGQSRDTEEEARHIAPVVGKQPFILVTEASHMPRALALFRKQGTDPIADPTDLRACDGGAVVADRMFPSAKVLFGSERAVYEYLGLAWGAIRGKL